MNINKFIRRIWEVIPQDSFKDWGNENRLGLYFGSTKPEDVISFITEYFAKAGSDHYDKGFDSGYDQGKHDMAEDMKTWLGREGY